MKYKFIVTENNIDFFFDIFEREGYSYGEYTGQSSYDNETIKTDLLGIKDGGAVKFIELDPDLKLYVSYTKWIKGDEFIEFAKTIQE